MNRMDLLREISNAPGVSGFEDAVLEVARAFSPKGTDFQEDSVRNLYLRHPTLSRGDRPLVMLDAHTDEVGFMVQAVMPNGLLKIIPLGGWMDYTIPAHKVLVRNRRGRWVTGVVATKPPHFMTAAERSQPMTLDRMAVDVGAMNATEVAEIFQIGIGAPIVPDVRFEYNPDTGIMLGKGFDCRVGCACVIDLLHRLIESQLEVDVVGALAAQEEVGRRGATVTARTVRPDIAIVFEGCPADDNCAEPYMVQTALKKGPMLRHIDPGHDHKPALHPLHPGYRGGTRDSGSGKCQGRRLYQRRLHPSQPPRNSLCRDRYSRALRAYPPRPGRHERLRKQRPPGGRAGTSPQCRRDRGVLEATVANN